MSNKEKIVPINKYSIYELKSGVDKQIITYLNNAGFQESQTNNNIQIILGILTSGMTAIAYFLNKPFPEGHTLVMLAVLGYVIFSTLYWFHEKFIVKTEIYRGKRNPDNGNKIENIVAFSEIKEHTAVYDMKLILTSKKGERSFQHKLNCNEFFDDRGYIKVSKIKEKIEKIIKEDSEKL